MASRAQLDLEVELKGADKASKGLGGVSKEAGVLGKAMSALKGGIGGIGSGLGAMMGPIGLVTAGVGALGAGLLGAAKAAADEEVGIIRMNTALKNALPAWDGNTAAVESYIAKQEKLAFADDQLRDSLGFLVTQTGDLAEAQNLQATAMDLARAKGIDLMTATKAVGKVDQDSIGILKKLGIEVTEEMTKEQALTAIRKASAGQAEAYANSTAGSMERAQNAFGNAMETIGGAVVPLLEGPLKALADFLQSDDFNNFASGAAAALGRAFQVLGDTVTWVLDNAIRPVWNFLSRPEVQANIANIANAIGTTLVGAFNGLKEVAGFVFDNIIKPLWDFFTSSEVTGAIGTVATAIGETLGNAFQFLKDHAGEVATAIGIVLIPAFTAWAISAGAAAVSTVAAFAPVIAAIAAVTAAVILFKTGWDNNFLGMRDTLTEWWDNIAPILSEVGQVVGTALVDAWNALSDAASNVWNSVLVPIWNYLSSDEVRPVLEGIATALGTVLKTAWDVVSTAAQIAWNNVLLPIWNFLTSSGMAEVIGNIANAIGTGLKVAWDVVSTAAKFAWDNVLKPIWDFFTGTDIAGAIGTAATAVGETLVNAFNGLKDAASAAWDMIVTVWEWLTGQAIQDASAAATGVVGVIDTELIGGLVRLQTEAKVEADIIGGNINKGMADAIHATKGVPVLEAVTMVSGTMQAAAKTAGSGASSPMHTVGANMGQGMADGIGSKLGAVVAKAKAIVQAGIDAAKSVSKQQSPSKVYHVMGENDAQGYIDGWWSKEPEVRATTAAVVSGARAEADRVMGDGSSAPYHIMGEDHAEDYQDGWWSELPEIEATVSNIQSTAAQRLAHLSEEDLAAIKAGGGLITDTLTQAILDTWPPLGEQILARFDETWGTAIERAQAMMAYLNNLNLYGSATGGPGYTPPPPGAGEGGTTRTVIPMAAGGDWMVRKPTLFLAGEAGPERATFTPVGKQGPMGTVNVYIGTVTTPNAREFVDQLDQELMRSQRLRTAAVGVPG
jgi:hypothetical protein